MKLQYLISIVALALTAQASSNSTNVSSTVTLERHCLETPSTQLVECHG
ncbi:hypothetical protein EYZ11_004560 [Aspergillus tanneri]|uniref:Uncharacterized protein n=1 Tax=Aspergillus tanneri TaxID=1220188 RepID=A0A4S3JKH0_9EURO|nr:hypothetical protein EYZ11_004560 [Aspergillus tanneri]